MSSSQCSILVVTDPESSDDSFPLLHNVFSYVTFAPPYPGIVGVLQGHTHVVDKGTSILVLLDDGVYSKTALFDTLGSIRFAMNAGILRHIAPIVYSSSKSTDYMQECLNHGAVHYILKPLREDVVLTLFLNIARLETCHHQTDKKQGPLCKIMDESNSNEKQGKMWLAFQRRLQSMFEVNHNLINQSISEYFHPDVKISLSGLRSISSATNDRLRTQICSWGFAPFDYNHYELVQCVFIVLRHVLNLPGLEYISVPDDDLYYFLFDVANMYQSLNPYHNFQHAVDVMQATYYFLCQIGALPPMGLDASPTLSSGKLPHGQYSWFQNNATIKDLISPLDILALILASIGHDVGHPGVNNMFMIKTATPLALMYNDRSVLESFHAMVFFNILQRHCFRPLTEWHTAAEYTRFRKIVMQSILATDMGLHDDYVNKIQGQAERLKAHSLDLMDQVQTENEVLLICGSLIKCADISNCARPFPVAKKWAEILQHEFHEQGDLEHELGLTVLPMNERGKVSLEDFQLGFKKNVAEKLFEAVSYVLPDMKYAVDSISNNCVIWESRKQRSHDSGVGDEAISSTISSDYGATDLDDHAIKVHDQGEIPDTVNDDQNRPYSPTGKFSQQLDQPRRYSQRHCIINSGIQHLGQNQQQLDEPMHRRKKFGRLHQCILQ